MLLESLLAFNGTLDQLMTDIVNQYHYIEAQLWCDEVVPGTVKDD